MAGASSLLRAVTGPPRRSFDAVAEELHCTATRATLGMEFLDVMGNRRVVSKGTSPIGGKMRHQRRQRASHVGCAAMLAGLSDYLHFMTPSFGASSTMVFALRHVRSGAKASASVSTIAAGKRGRIARKVRAMRGEGPRDASLRGASSGTGRVCGCRPSVEVSVCCHRSVFRPSLFRSENRILVAALGQQNCRKMQVAEIAANPQSHWVHVG